METPSSTRRVTRSQALAALNSNNFPVSKRTEDSGKALSKSRQRNAKQQDRSALIDITNDSPIIGLATGNPETPLSSIAKQKGSRVNNTPGSGEALLRGQVKTLLQKVEEEAELSKLSLESRPFPQLVNSPTTLLAPTPANTPQISNLSGDGCGNNSAGLASVTSSPVIEEEGLISEVMNHMYDSKNQESAESEKSLTRSLLLDFSEKSEVFDASECFSELSYQEVAIQGGCREEPSTEDDDVSVWSIQVNASTHDEDEEDIAEEDEDYCEDIEEEEDGELLAELCEGLNNIRVNERVAPKFAGKHTRFVYNSDDESLLVEEKEDSVSPNVLHLKGLPTPKGKHLRFPEEE
ncbi:hypothetical protein L6164_027633 [Bauhinia variegata]|uniref:Uncharacterized protein n=1 Tax=Bauhinia variegata TaxID=167791 RepID=A0ACB9LU03_BAUVA|nr:hypothetical protein L6164_027633 [Bauhinia variegata]